MARTIEEIYNEIMTEKGTLSSLDNLTPGADDANTLKADYTSTSKVSPHRLWAWVTAFAMYLHEQLWDTFKSEVEEIEASVHYGTAPWWHKEILAYQHGDSLTWDGEKYAYPAITEANQIIKRAAVETKGGKVRLKVAKLDGNGDPVPLSSSELTSFDGWVKKVRPVGEKTLTISLQADLLQLHFEVFYDPLLLNDDGSLISDNTVFPVEDAINNYLADLPFNGVLHITFLTDAIQEAEGVVNPVFTDAKGKTNSATSWTDFDVSYNPEAGYMEVDTANFPLSTTITYTPNV